MLFFLLFVPLLLTACGGGGSGGGNATSENSPTATLTENVITLDSSPTVSDFAPNSEGGGSITLDIDSDAVTNWEGEIVVLPPSDGVPDGFIMRVTDVQATVSKDGKSNVTIQYSTPELDEVFKTIDYNPENLYDSAKIDRFYTPVPFTEDIVSSNLAAKSTTAAAAKTVNGKREWFNGVNLVGKFKVFEEGRKGFSLNVDGLNIMEFKPDDGNVAHEQKISLGGGFEFYLNDLVSPISKGEDDSIDQRLIIDYTIKESLKVTAEGSMELSAAELAGKKFQCGVSGVDKEVVKISGAKWRDNICLGGVSIALAPMPFSFIAGNGTTQTVKAPVAVDIFFTMNTALKVEVNGFYKISKHSRNKRGLVVDLSQKNDADKFSVINEEYDVDVFNQTGNKVGSQYNSRIEGSISGEWSSQVGVAGALRVSNIYPLDIEAYGELSASGEVSAGYSSINSDPFASGGDYCFKIGVMPKLGYYLSSGLSAKIAKDLNIFGWKKKVNIGGGFSFIHEGDIWKPEKKTEYDSCDSENFSIDFDLNSFIPYQVSMSNIIIKSKSDGIVRNPEFTMWRIYNSQGILIKEGANLSQLVAGIDNVGEYIAEVFVRLSAGDGGVKIRKQISFSVIGYAPRDLSLQAGNSSVILNWTNNVGISYKVCAREKNSTFNVLNITLACELAENSSSLLRVHEVSAAPLIIASLTNGSLYEFVVIATDSAGRSSATMPIIGIPQANALVAPANLKATLGDSKLTLTWDTVQGATSYAYCVSTTQNSPDCSTYSVSNPLWKDATGTTVTTDSLTNGTAYYFRVVAKNSSGESPVSAEATATPQKTNESLLFRDDFDTLNKDLWTVVRIGGNWKSSTPDYDAVTVSGGNIRLLMDKTDDGPVMYSRVLKPKSGQVMKIKWRNYVHPENRHFNGSIGIRSSLGKDLTSDLNLDKWLCGVRHYDETYEGDWNGFYLDDSPQLLKITPYWNQWVEEEFTYDPVSGYATYTVNGETVSTTCKLPETAEPYFRLSIHSYGWWTGHYTDMDYIEVSGADYLSASSGTVVGVVAGNLHSLALKRDGTVVAWGGNEYGQSNVPEGLDNVTAIAAGYGHSLALKQNGTVVGWGGVGYGEANAPVGLSGVTAIAAGKYHSLALKGDGTVVGWGSPNGGTDVPSNLSGVIAIAAGGEHSLALMQDGTVVAWGYNRWGQIDIPLGLKDVTAIAAGEYHSIALKKDGTVVSWGGQNQFGENNIPLSLSNVVAISAGYWHSLALKRDGTVVAWGNPVDATVPNDLDSFVAIAAGHSHSLALKQDGYVVVWGHNNAGQQNVPVELTKPADNSNPFTVQATDEVGTAFTVPAGKTQCTFNATGTWGETLYDSFSADGFAGYYLASAVNSSAPIGSLIMKKSNGIYDVAGNSSTKSLVAGESLRFLFNDLPGSYGDNNGSQSVSWSCQ